MNFNRPKFITFEGGEGSGKSTQSKLLYQYLLSKNIKVIHTREVGGTPEAEKIRDLLVYSELLPMSELMLVMAARYEHINKVIVPALLEGRWVICDRFVDSTACYQSGDSGLTMDDIYELHATLMNVSYSNEAENVLRPEVEIHELTEQGVMPDITFFMDVPPQIGLERSAKAGDTNKFEDKNLDFHNVVYERFKSITETQGERVKNIECINKSIDEIHNIIVGKLF